MWPTTRSFNPRSPCGERPRPVGGYGAPKRPVSTHAPLAGSDDSTASSRRQCSRVSTHAPLAGSDKAPGAQRPRGIGFNPRSPCGERPGSCEGCAIAGWFQPTLPLRGATYVDAYGVLHVQFQPTLPLRGATHSALGRGRGPCGFQPTLPLRGATGGPRRATICIECFNPRSPCGERLKRVRLARGRGGFNPRSPCGERLAFPRLMARCMVVSTHAPLAGSDWPPCI